MSAWTRCRFLAAEFSAFALVVTKQLKRNEEIDGKTMKLDGNP
jgi:hypothetical protein